ncbi:protein of unknown function [Taphrina deformans PYCC 5710]|uniref:Uncharacterized protein n=1 Tax=Taphrina deformans (strain PYCC 5710 / ATCC 11124 / CBS 356.35 / IMI 108563 / JCM 9778 / NBRC 8474) TaxID=1097556 RepID=R4XAN2_TAPDE|nr:protein of unknown function [Taphrina deformans PYCC 5710]|eukprot:CCG82899.1 protein of unknown function [Taphrina deformans PYCC 5710]
MLWFSIGESGSIGTTSMALPMPKHMPTASTRLDGFSAADTTDRLATLLCRKYGRQVFVSAHLPRTQMQMIQSEDGNGEEVIVKKVLIELHRVVKQEGDTDRVADDGTTESTKHSESQAPIDCQDGHLPQKIDESAVNDGLEDLTLDT